MRTDEQLAPGLYVAATPIGNLGDVTRRLEHILAKCDYVLCEDTRVTGRLCHALGIKAELRTYHDHNGHAVRPGILTDLANSLSIALVSDAGTPLIADPGFKLVRDARAQGSNIFAVPGPSALTAALSIAGVPTDKFSFHGFLPPKTTARQKYLHTLSEDNGTLVFYESGPRLADCLADISHVLGDRAVIIGRELTKRHEEVVSGNSLQLAERYAASAPKGEIVLILSPAEKETTDEQIDLMMRDALSRLSLKDAAAEIAAKTGRRKRDLYQAWLNKDA